MDSDRYLALWAHLKPHLRLHLEALVSSIEANGYAAAAITQGGDEEFWLDVDFKREGEAVGGFRLQLSHPDVQGEEHPSIDLVQQGMGGRHLMGYRVEINPERFADADSGNAVSELFGAPNLLQDSLYRLFLQPSDATEPLEDTQPF